MTPATPPVTSTVPAAEKVSHKPMSVARLLAHSSSTVRQHSGSILVKPLTCHPERTPAADNEAHNFVRDSCTGHHRTFDIQSVALWFPRDTTSGAKREAGRQIDHAGAAPATVSEECNPLKSLPVEGVGRPDCRSDSRARRPALTQGNVHGRGVPVCRLQALAQCHVASACVQPDSAVP